LQYQDIAIGGC